MNGEKLPDTYQLSLWQSNTSLFLPLWQFIEQEAVNNTAAWKQCASNEQSLCVHPGAAALTEANCEALSCHEGV